MAIFIILADIIVLILMIGAKKSKFVKEYLKNDESIIAKAQNSGVIVSVIVIIMAVINLNLITVSQFVNNNYGSSGILEIIFCLLLLTPLFRMLNNYCREFVVTNKRIVLKKGILSRNVKEFRYDKLESCAVKQSILGRALNFGTIVLYGTGGSIAAESFIKDPYIFRQHLIDKIV